AVEPIEGPSEQARARLLGFQHQGSQRWAEGEGVERRENDRNRNGDGELLVEPPGDAGNEGGGYEDSGKDQGNADHRTRDLFHGSQGRLFGSEPILDMPLHSLYHDDGIVHHETDRQNEAEKRKRIDREPK